MTKSRRNQPGRLGTAHDRFWRKVRKGGPDDCWVWTATTNPDGYGRFYAGVEEGGGLVGAHRQSWEWATGRSAGDLCVLHRCDNPRCVNPAHLFLGTQLDNMRDRDRKGRRRPPTGELNGRAKLAASDVREIRVSPLNDDLLADVYGVSRQTIQSVRSAQTWKAA